MAAARRPFLGRLKWLKQIAECDRRGLVVGRHPVALVPGLTNYAAHQLQAVETLLAALKPDDNWFFDLAKLNIDVERCAPCKRRGV